MLVLAKVEKTRKILQKTYGFHSFSNFIQIWLKNNASIIQTNFASFETPTMHGWMNIEMKVMLDKGANVWLLHGLLLHTKVQRLLCLFPWGSSTTIIQI